MSDKKIAVIDSGLGGLTVVKLLRERMPNENIIYLGDNARVPYGDKSKENINQFAKQIVEFLIKQDIKYLIIACNTMSSVALNTIKKTTDVPIAEVITPTIEYIKTHGYKSVGVIATKATTQSKIYEDKIKKETPDCKVYGMACPLFVPIIEMGVMQGEEVDNTIEEGLCEYKNIKPEVLVLGCTHYTAWEQNIKDYLGNNIAVINTSIPVVEYAICDIKEKGLLNTSGKKGATDLYFSDSCEKYKEYFKNLFEDTNIKTTENIDL